MQADCPAKDELLAYTLGRLPSEQSVSIDVHLEDCPTCQAELETCASVDDTFLSRLRSENSSEPFLAEAECADALARVAAIGQEPSFTTQRQMAGQAVEEDKLGNIGPYRLLAKLGAGGMGTVYKALHTKLKRVVALKMLPADRMQDRQAVARFEREMEAVGKLDHPNIVRATDAGEHDGKHFLVMEYVEGVDLSQLSKQHGPLPTTDACELIRQAAIGLQHAHESGLVHRDIKPSNLMLTASGGRQPTESASEDASSSIVATHSQGAYAPRSPTVKILDLGLALLDDAGDEDAPELTATGQTMGTLDYMAPEQGGDSHDVDIRADIYSLGATLYKLLCGQAIYAGAKYTGAVQKLTALALVEAPPIQERRDGVSDEIAAVVHKMIAKNRDERYTTPGEVADALASFCDAADLASLSADNVSTGTPLGSRSTTSLVKESASLDTNSVVTGSLPVPQSATSQGATAGLPSSADAKPQASPRKQIPNKLLIAGGAGLLGIIAVLAAMVFYFQTPNGTLRVEIDDPDIKVEVKGENIVLSNADKKPIRLKAGEHTLIVTRGDDFTFETKQFILKKGETTTVKVELLPGKVQVVSAGEVIGSGALGEALQSTRENFVLEFNGDRSPQSYVEIPLDGVKPSAPFTIEGFLHLDEQQFVAGPRNWFVWSWTQQPSLAIWQTSSRENRFWTLQGRAAIDGHGQATKHLTVRPGTHHVAMVWKEGGTVTFFLNGIPHPLGGGSSAAGRRDLQPALILGGARSHEKRRIGYFDGQLDEMRLSTVARYDKPFTPPRPDARFKPDKHTLALYHFDEGAGDVLHDSSGNGHHGKIVGAKWVRVGDYGSTPSIIIKPQPLAVKLGEPMSRMTPVVRPQPLPGLVSWTIDTTKHRGAARTLRFSPDGRWLASGGNDGTIRIRDASNGELVRLLVGHNNPVKRLEWLPDSRVVVSLGTDNSPDPSEILLWDATTGELLRSIQVGSSTDPALAVSPGGERLAIASGGELTIFETKSGSRMSSCSIGQIFDMSWSPCGRWIAVGGWQLVLVDAAAGMKKSGLKPVMPHNVRGIVWSGTAPLVAAADHHTIRVWDAKSRELIREFKYPEGQYAGSLAFLPDGGSILAIGSSRRVWNITEGVATELSHLPEGYLDVAISADGQRVALAHDRGGIWIGGLKETEPVVSIGEYQPEGLLAPASISLSPDARQVMFSGPIQLARVTRDDPNLNPIFGGGNKWNAGWAPTGNRLKYTSERSHVTICFNNDQKIRLLNSEELSTEWSPDGTMLAGARDVVRIYDADSGNQIKRFESTQELGSTIAWSPDGRFLAVEGRDDEIEIWDVAQEKAIQRLGDHAPDIKKMVWSNDGMLLAASSADRSIRIWNTESGNPLPFNEGRGLGGIAGLTFSPDKKYLARGGNNMFTLWEVQTGKLVYPSGKLQNVLNIDFSEDGRWMSVIVEDNGFRIFDLQRGELVTETSGHLPSVYKENVDWSLKHDLIANASLGLQAHLWQASTGDPLSAMLLLGKDAVYLSPEGHFLAAESVQSDLRYVALTTDGRQLTLTPAEFEEQFGWKNDPAKVKP